MDQFTELGSESIKKLAESIKLINIDLHLHKQVLNNEQYVPKINDLEDWAGLSLGAAYYDVLVCEKHFKSMIEKNGYKVNAIVTTELKDIIKINNMS